MATGSEVVSGGAVGDCVVGDSVVGSGFVSDAVVPPVVPTGFVVVGAFASGLVAGAAVVLFLSGLLELLPQDEFFFVAGSAGISP